MSILAMNIFESILRQSLTSSKHSLAKRGFAPLLPNQCELTYINLITVPEGPGNPLSKILKYWRPTPSPSLGEAEDVAFTVRFLMRDAREKPIGRVIAQASPGFDKEGHSVVQLALIGRGPPAEPTLASALKFMDLARERIVCGFGELTTEKMQALWNRKDWL